MYYDDLELGTVFVSRGRTVTEADLVNFAGLSGDFNELHTNEEYARESPFGRRVAHGALVFSISIGLTTQTGQLDRSVLAFYAVDRLRFTQPVYIGDTITVRKRILDKQDKGQGRGLVVFDTKVVNQRDEIVLVYQDKLLIRKRG